MYVRHWLVQILACCLLVVQSAAADFLFVDTFDSLDIRVWNREYAYPVVSDGYARFNLEPGTINTAATWCKLSYKDRLFGYGTYSMRFRLSRRPLDAQVWAGWALYSATQDGQNEINFGIMTSCRARCSDSTIILESYKNRATEEVVAPLGYSFIGGDGWHDAELVYTQERISLSLNGTEVAAITDRSVIPAAPMKLIPGARVASGALTSSFFMDIDSLSIQEYQATQVRSVGQWHPHPQSGRPFEIRIYSLKGQLLGSISSCEMTRNAWSRPLANIAGGAGTVVARVVSGDQPQTTRLIHLNSR